MTATRKGTAFRAAALILLIAAWAVGATRLWQTAVPHSLDTSGLDVHRWFPAHELDRARRYWRFVEADWVLGVIAEIAALVVLVRRAPRVARSIGLGPIGSGVIVGMLTLVTLWFVQLPFSFAAQWWAARHGLAPHDYLSWLAAPWAALSFEAAYAMGVIVLVMWLARKLGRSWWIAGAPVFVGLAILFAFLQGYVAASGTKPLRPALRAQVARLERAERVDAPVRVQKVSTWTSQANAFTAGLGPSTHVVLWDTLLDGRFTRGEVAVVVAHELGHVARRHIWKTLAWLALLAFPTAFLVAEATRPRGGMGNPAAIPLAFLVLTLASLVALPVENAVSRRYEAEADWSALQATRDPASTAKLFRSFERTSLEEPSPPAWDYWLLENHPTLAQRIAMATRWRAVTRSGGDKAAASAHRRLRRAYAATRPRPAAAAAPRAGS